MTKKKLKRLRAKQNKVMSDAERQMVATKQFINRLPNKKYFKRFANKDDGIPEANWKDEDTQTVEESVDEDNGKRKKNKRKGDKAGSPRSQDDEGS